MIVMTLDIAIHDIHIIISSLEGKRGGWRDGGGVAGSDFRDGRPGRLGGRTDGGGRGTPHSERGVLDRPAGRLPLPSSLSLSVPPPTVHSFNPSFHSVRGWVSFSLSLYLSPALSL